MKVGDRVKVITLDSVRYGIFDEPYLLNQEGLIIKHPTGESDIFHYVKFDGGFHSCWMEDVQLEVIEPVTI